MAHAKLNLQRMYDWIETSLREGAAMPTDAQICEFFGFETTEQARTLLAELADAQRITIKGYGETRQISLGRVRSALAAVGRIQPPVARADPVVERGVARLREIVERDRPARAVLAENAGKLLATVTPAPPVVAPIVKKEPVMPSKSIMLPASAVAAIAAVDALAESDDITIGHAASLLIERGAAKPAPVPAPLSFDALLDLVRDRFAERPDQSADLAAAVARADAAEARADAAEAKFAQAKALFA